MRKEWKWTDKQVDKLNMVLAALTEFEEYLPLTLRQIFYQLVSKGYIKNSVSEYIMLSKLVKYARIDNKISWDAIEDRVRDVHDVLKFDDAEEFISCHLDNFLENYTKYLMQNQNAYIEIWLEKDALSSLFTKVASKYGIPVVVCRGFSSISFLHDFMERIVEHDDKEPVMLYFGDFDPSGNEMLPAMQETLENELGVPDVKFKRIALTKEDIVKYNLPHSPNALKAADTRAKKHIAEHGYLAVELDALPPNVLTSKIKDAIENEIDMDLYEEMLEEEGVERIEVVQLKQKVCKFLKEEE